MEAVALQDTKTSSSMTNVPAPGTTRRPERLVTVVGDLSLPRSLEYLAQAAYLVRKAWPEVRFKLALGPGTCRLQDERLAALALQDNLEVTAMPHASGILTLAGETDVLVVESLPPHLETAVLFYLPNTLPLVVSRQLDRRYVPYQAALADVWDSRRMAQAIIRKLDRSPVVGRVRDRVRGQC